MSALDPKALFSMSYGMYIVTSVANGQIANAVMQITAVPETVAVCINKQNLTHERITESGLLAVSVLDIDVPMTFIGQFGFKSGRDTDKFAGVDVVTGELGVPMVKSWCVSSFDARVTGSIDVHTHTIFIGELASTVTFKEGRPLTYADYHLVKKGRSPKTAPTFAFNALK
jgi:ferric-chelate reductase [NAD(P)H]